MNLIIKIRCNNKENDIKKLSGSLIYKMSQGSKELYHSNIWSWLIEQDAEFINAFIDDIDKDAFYTLMDVAEVKGGSFKKKDIH